MKKITMLVFLFTVLGLSREASAVDSVLSEEELVYQVDAILYDGDEACAAVGAIRVDYAESDEDRRTCHRDQGTDVALSVNVRQRVESIIDGAIAMDSQQEANRDQ